MARRPLNQVLQNMPPEMLLPNKFGYLVIIGFVILFGAIWDQHNVLPTPVMKKSADSHPGQFIAEYAYFQLKTLTSFGPKVFGNYSNEVLAVEFLTREISYLKAAAVPYNNITYDIQETSGCYYLGFLPYGFVNCYNSVKNIIVKLSSADNSGKALLINCHYDSVPESPGSSDDGLNCVVMLEILRILSRAPVPLKHDIIFLFNGAEETPLQASHGFITQHPWAKDVKAFINLEACGAGGREILFQAGPNHPWLVKLYATSVPHPHALVVAEEIFQSGMVPSDTDFRIFRDFGHVPGLDFAHATNGYVYHTKYDNLDYIPLGTIQHTGDNLLALVKRIGSSNELSEIDRYSEGHMVYFDILGYIIVAYQESTGFIINIMTVLMSYFTQWMIIKGITRDYERNMSWNLLLQSCKVTVLGWISGAVCLWTTAMLLDGLGYSMSWYSYPSIIFPLYFCPVISAGIYFFIYHEGHLMSNLTPLEKAHVYTVGVQHLLCICLLLATLMNIRSSFVLMLILAPPSITNLILIVCKKQQSFYLWASTYLLASTIGVGFVMYLAIMAFSLFIPITGRIGAGRNPEFLIGGLSFVLNILSSSLLIPLIVLVRKPKRFLHQFGVLYLLVLVAIMYTPVGFPYRGDLASPAPQRIIIHHTHQRFHHIGGSAYHDASGFWVTHLDRHNPGILKDIVPEYANSESVEHMCEETLFCGLPMFSPRMLPVCKDTFWIPAEDPTLHFATSLKHVESKWLSEDLLEMTFVAIGPDRMEIYMSPHADVTLSSWTFNATIPNGEPLWNKRSTYFIHYASGILRSELTFSLNLQLEHKRSEYILDVAVVGHYINSHKTSKGFKAFLKKFPDWAHITPMTSMYASWRF